MQAETNDDGSYLNEAQQNRIKEAQAIDANYWFDWLIGQSLEICLVHWNVRLLSILVQCDRVIALFKSLKQAQFALKIVEKAEELGYQG